MHEKLIRQLSSQVADALAEQELACAPNRRAALALRKTPGWAGPAASHPHPPGV